MIDYREMRIYKRYPSFLTLILPLCTIGFPFLNQLTWGMGDPAKSHDNRIVWATVITFSLSGRSINSGFSTKSTSQVTVDTEK